MEDLTVDAPWLWLGLAIASVATLGVALSLPAAPPPDATAVRTAIDRVASSPRPAATTTAVAADRVRIGTHRLALRGPGGVTRATLRYGPVTPVADSGPLARVLAGEPPGALFEGRTAFRRALDAARNRTPTWRPTDGSIRVRSLVWEGTRVTLVGA